MSMSATLELNAPPVDQTSTSEAVQKVLLHGVSWETYERLLSEPEGSNTRFTYDQGALEIMVLSAEHENCKDMIFLLINVLAAEFGIDVDSFGSTTFRREDLERGFEPDACFYFQNVEHVRGKKRLDLTLDLPPDLVVEVDIAHPSLDKFPLFAAIGIPEILTKSTRQDFR
jgi:Uma2 family endonuclease